ncbi:MAG TPA: malto-oligosyltrehalose trehalohydrolase [Actinomycetota bacterium]
MSASIRVWAPTPARVELVTSEGRTPMERDERGWWSVTLDAAAGLDYTFSLDGGPARPDPRSPWQPSGVDGPSRTIDHTEFEWSDHHWHGRPLAGSVVYELHVGTFTGAGTFEAAIERLDHLVDLGITTVELMPVAEFSGERGWGYDGVDLYTPHHAYGGPEGLKRLVDACHGRGLAVVLDVVYNHLGPAGNYLREFGPYFTDKHSTPWGDAVNFDDAHSGEVRAFFVDNALMWLRDYHFDGLRIDAVHAIVDTSATHILEQMSDAVEELEGQVGRELVLIAESDLNDPRIITNQAAGGYGIDAQWSDDFHHALHALLTGEREGYYADFGSVGAVAKALRHAYVYAGDYSAFRRRVHGRPAAGLSGNRFLGYLQNHDQIGNRAVGERSGALMSHDLLKVGAALVLTSPFVPMLFMGEEWGASTPFLYFTAHADPALGRAVSEGRRREFAAFGWRPEDVPDPQSVETFERSRLRCAEIDEQPHADLLEWHRQLIRLRASTPALTDGRMDLVRTRYDEDARWLVVERGEITIAANGSSSPARIPIESRRTSELLLHSGKIERDADVLVLGPESVAIFRNG